MSWYVNGELHRDNGLPAIEWANGDKEWYVNGKCHRDGGLPAIIFSNGTKEWYQNGKLHRDGGLPAVVRSDGNMLWYKDGNLFYISPHCSYLTRKNSVKLINCADEICPITLDEICNMSEVSKCCICKKVFMFSAMSNWLKTSNTCPHCRSVWINYEKYMCNTAFQKVV
jgi:hypothetical protein